ncbi:MAG: hypothetical protein AB7G80_09850 [Dongiaceae bacterium]
MGNPFSKPKKPQPDPELERQRAAEAARVAKEKADSEQRAADEEAARMRRLRGQRSLLGGGYTGFGLGGNGTLG